MPKRKRSAVRRYEFWVESAALDRIEPHSRRKAPGGAGVYFWNDISDWSRNHGFVKIKISIEEISGS